MAEIAALAEKHEAHLLFEAAVAGAIPIVAGFQGVAQDTKDITRFSRIGSIGGLVT